MASMEIVAIRSKSTQNLEARHTPKIAQLTLQQYVLIHAVLRNRTLVEKNWLFIGAPEAGSKAANFLTLLGSCLRRGFNPRDYLLLLFARLPTATNRTAADLTPAAFARFHAGASGCTPLRLYAA